VRLFVAVDLDDAGRAAVDRLIARVRSSNAPIAKTRIASWVPAERLHLTLQFLANVEAADAARIAEAVGRPIELPAFDIAFGGLGTFPKGSRARVIWLGVREGIEALVKLHEITGVRLKALGFELEKRPFTPHLTLARLREGAPARSMRSVVATDANDDVGRSRVDCVHLYESRLASGGPKHTVIATGLLSAGA
jgi:2'-5' RNA ligase